MVGAASWPLGLACPPASGAEPEYCGVLPGQSCRVSLRGPAQRGRADEEYPENHPAGGLGHSPPLKSLRKHTHRDRMCITSRDTDYTVGYRQNFCRELWERESVGSNAVEGLGNFTGY